MEKHKKLMQQIWITRRIIFCIRHWNLFWVKKYGEDTDDPSIIYYVNKLENRITVEIKNGYYLELLIPETMKLLGTTENKITEDKNCENVPHIENTKVVLVQSNIANNNYQQD